jgi:hypothetical protein
VRRRLRTPRFVSPLAPAGGQFIVDPIVLLPVVRNVVAGNVPSAARELNVVDAFVDTKDGVEIPESQLLPDEVTDEPLLTDPELLLTARFLPSFAAPVAK